VRLVCTSGARYVRVRVIDDLLNVRVCLVHECRRLPIHVAHDAAKVLVRARAAARPVPWHAVDPGRRGRRRNLLQHFLHQAVAHPEAQARSAIV
jgi:hypothetical protein